MTDDGQTPSHDPEGDLEKLRQAVLDDWVTVTTRSSAALEAIQSTVSWRITRPLRLARTFGKVSQERGLASATELAAAQLARKLGARR